MTEYIPKDKVLELWRYWKFIEAYDQCKEMKGIDIDLTDGRPQGEWIEHKWIEYNEELMLEMPMHNYECSKCHSILHEVKETNFCPNCGADMRKGADDE